MQHKPTDQSTIFGVAFQVGLYLENQIENNQCFFENGPVLLSEPRVSPSVGSLKRVFWDHRLHAMHNRPEPRGEEAPKQALLHPEAMDRVH